MWELNDLSVNKKKGYAEFCITFSLPPYTSLTCQLAHSFHCRKWMELVTLLPASVKENVHLRQVYPNETFIFQPESCPSDHWIVALRYFWSGERVVFLVGDETCRKVDIQEQVWGPLITYNYIYINTCFIGFKTLWRPLDILIKCATLRLVDYLLVVKPAESSCSALTYILYHHFWVPMTKLSWTFSWTAKKQRCLRFSSNSN